MKLVGLIILQGLLEMTGTVALSLVLARTCLSWKRALLVGSGLFILVQVFRYMPFFFGLHTLVGLLALTIYLIRSERVTVVSGFMAAFVSLFVLGLFEFASNNVILWLVHVDPGVATADPELWALIGLPQAAAMVLLAWCASRIVKPHQRRR